MGAPSQTQPVDFGAMFKRLSTADKVIGASLILLLIDSFISTWFHYSIDNCGGLSSQFSSACSSTYGSLWGDLGIVAALLLLVAIAFYVIRLFFSTQVELPALPLPDWQLWMAFGVVEIVLFALHWLIGRGNFAGFDIGSAPGVSRPPGWGLYVGILLAIAIVVGGYLKQNEPQPVAAGTRVTPSAGGYGAPPPSAPPSTPGGYGAPPPPPSAPPPPPPAAPPPAPPAG